MKFFDVYENWCDDTLLRVYPRKNNTDNKTEVKTMDKNKAPNKIEGTYMVMINGNETTITPVGFEDAVHFYGKTAIRLRVTSAIQTISLTLVGY